MYLDRILGTATKVNIIAALVARPGKKLIECELAQAAGMAQSGVAKQARDLVACGLVRMERIAGANVYSMCEEHFLFPRLKALFVDLNRVYREHALRLTKFIVKRHKIAAVILIGSAYRGNVRQDFVGEPSDLDLVVIAAQPKAVLKDLIDEDARLFGKYAVNCYPIVISPAEYRKRLKAGDEFILGVQAEGGYYMGRDLVDSIGWSLERAEQYLLC